MVIIGNKSNIDNKSISSHNNGNISSNNDTNSKKKIDMIETAKNRNKKHFYGTSNNSNENSNRNSHNTNHNNNNDKAPGVPVFCYLMWP